MDITLDITDDVGLIRFDDGKKNAFTLDGIKNLTGVFDEAEANAKAIVLTGRPGSFCAGFDLATMIIICMRPRFLEFNSKSGYSS